MDILRKELNGIYKKQSLVLNQLDYSVLDILKREVRGLARLSFGCGIITDIYGHVCNTFSEGLLFNLGVAEEYSFEGKSDSTDEDDIYVRMHPEDLADKRMLEYEFFKLVDAVTPAEKTSLIAKCRVRIRNRQRQFVLIDNTTRILKLSGNGNFWLILCCYYPSLTTEWTGGIGQLIINTKDFTTIVPELNKRNSILTRREKEILLMIKSGKPSKEIAGELGISLNTVNRHRQNILEKLSVGNSIEAVNAATAMKLL